MTEEKSYDIVNTEYSVREFNGLVINLITANKAVNKEQIQ